MKLYTIYQHTIPSGWIYVGQTCRPVIERWKQGYRSNPHFNHAIKKYGWNNIKHEILFEGLTKEEADAKEIELIHEYRDRGLCLNIANGGDGGDTFTSRSEKSKTQTRQKISSASAKQKWTPERCQKISIARKGHKVSEETRAKISKSLRGTKNPNFGKPKSGKVRQKLAEANRGKHCGKNNRHYGLKGEKSWMYGRKWISNGTKSLLIKFSDVDKYLSEGWHLGRN